MMRLYRGSLGRKAGAVLIAVLGGLILICMLAANRWLHPYNLASELAAAKAAGIPLTPAEFPQYAPPPEQNAARDYAEMDELLQRRPLDSSAVATKGTWRPRTEALESLITGRPDFARIVHAAAARPHAFYKHGFGNQETWPQFEQMQQCANWIRLESLLLARKGRYREAVKHQALGYRFASHAGEEPVLDGQFTSIRCEAVTLLGFADILREAGPNAVVAQAVSREIAAYKPNMNLTRCLKGEMLFGLTSYNDMADLWPLVCITGMGGRLDAEFETQWHVNAPLPPDAGKDIYVHWMTRCVLASQLPERQRVAAMERVLSEFERKDAFRVENSLPTEVKAICDELNINYTAGLSKVVGIPTGLMELCVIAATCETSVRAETVAVATVARLVAYRAKKGRYPNTLGSAGIPVPVDPIGGKPFTYQRTAAGFVMKPIRKPHQWTDEVFSGCQLAFRYP